MENKRFPWLLSEFGKLFLWILSNTDDLFSWSGLFVYWQIFYFCISIPIPIKL
jgi:hypothetical protein